MKRYKYLGDKYLVVWDYNYKKILPKIKSYKMNYSYRIKKDDIIVIDENITRKDEKATIFKIVDEPQKVNKSIVFTCKVITSSIEKYKSGDDVKLFTTRPGLFGLMIHEVWLFIAKIFKLPITKRLQ